VAEADSLTYRRVHRAPRELVFACMTTPEHLTEFWGPIGTTTPVAGITLDLRVGGVFETVMVNDADGSRYTMRVIYTEVNPPERLAWRDPASGMVTEITFTDRGDGTTEVVTRQMNVPEAYRTAEARAGFATSLDRFDAYIARLVTTD
jgi:uncharacterized protein YndB with AHSA1/START domain